MQRMVLLIVDPDIFWFLIFLVFLLFLVCLPGRIKRFWLILLSLLEESRAACDCWASHGRKERSVRGKRFMSFTAAATKDCLDDFYEISK